jgi:hypothetical protein
VTHRILASRSKSIGLGLVLATGIATLGEGIATADSIYRFIDDQGVLHFSDSPRDDRYSRIQPVYQEGLAITPRRQLRVPRERHYDRLIVQLATRHGVQPALVKAVIAAESNFQPDAISRVGAQGLMQLMPATAQELGVERPLGVVDNVDGGVRYLRAMLDRYGDVTRSLAAYNAGPTAVDRYRGVPPYPETLRAPRAPDSRRAARGDHTGDGSASDRSPETLKPGQPPVR